MPAFHLKPIVLSALALVLTGAHPGAAWAGMDAGAQIRRYQDEMQKRLAPASAEDKALPKPPVSRSKAVAASSSARILVSAFDMQGVTRFTHEEIAAVLAPFVGKELDTADIHAAADAVNLLYRQSGFFVAKVFVPPQDVAGTVQLDVYEGLLDDGGLEVVNKGQQIKAEVVQKILEANIPKDQPVHRAHYERALLLAEDLPGVTTASTLYPGIHVGTVRLRMTLTDLPRLAGNIDTDNFGSESTGPWRLGTTLYLNSPGQVGDQATARLVASGGGSNYAYLNYLLPVSAHGTRLGFSADHLNYRAKPVVQIGQSQGEANDVRVYLTHSILRSRHANIALRVDLSRLALDDRNDLQINASRRVTTAVIALHADDDHARMGDGVTVFDLAVTQGTVDVRGNASYQAIDRAAARTDGSFTRWNLSASRLQRLVHRWSLLTRLNAQWASGNLDSSQRLYLGGATSIMGYPVGEASGDQGAAVSVELQHEIATPMGGTLVGGLSFQQGWLQQHKTTWTGWQGSNSIQDNNMRMQSVGLHLVQTLPGGWVIRGALGRQLGANPMRDPITAVASDGKRSKVRGWVQAVTYF